MEPLKSQKLRDQALAVLKEEIAQMKPGENQLPSEGDLAKRLNISRTTVREVMQILASEGYITRRHGKGNFAHPSATKLPHRIDLTADFFKLLSTDGIEADYETLRSGYAPLTEEMRRVFPSECEKVYEQFWLYRTDGKPMILCKNYVPDCVFAQPLQPGHYPQGIFSWVAQYCHKDVAYFAASMDCGVDDEAAWALRLPAGTVLQSWKEVGYDIYDMPVVYSDIFFHPKNVNLSMTLHL